MNSRNIKDVARHSQINGDIFLNGQDDNYFDEYVKGEDEDSLEVDLEPYEFLLDGAAANEEIRDILDINGFDWSESSESGYSLL